MGPEKGGPNSYINAVSCPASVKAHCVAVGGYVDSNFEQQGFFLRVPNNGEGLKTLLNETTTTQAPSATRTTVQPATTTSTAPATTVPTTTLPVSQITLASLEAAIAQQANAVPPSPGEPPGSWTVTCGPPSASLAVGADIECGSFNPAIGSSEEVVQITGTSPSSFMVLVGPGSDIPCAGLSAAEEAAMADDANPCDPNGG
jgi:hypothetical protein